MIFMVHNGMTPVLCLNKDSSKNVRDLGISYFLVWLIYLLIGIFGAFGIVGREVGH